MNYYSSDIKPVVQNIIKREREALESVIKGLTEASPAMANIINQVQKGDVTWIVITGTDCETGYEFQREMYGLGSFGRLYYKDGKQINEFDVLAVAIRNTWKAHIKDFVKQAKEHGKSLNINSMKELSAVYAA